MLLKSYIVYILRNAIFCFQIKDVSNKIEESEFEHARLESENAKLASDLKVKVNLFSL